MELYEQTDDILLTLHEHGRLVDVCMHIGIDGWMYYRHLIDQTTGETSVVVRSGPLRRYLNLLILAQQHFNTDKEFMVELRKILNKADLRESN